MPRKARIDAPGALHHIIVRGIARRRIFDDDEDRKHFIERFEKVVSETETQCFAWALIPNHFHLLLKTGATPLSTAMKRLLTGYAMHYNRRHKRSGHLFQNRYKSILCQEDTYLLELVRYIHLNPLRAGLIKDMKALDQYPYSGHSVIMGNTLAEWHNAKYILEFFDSKMSVSRRRYREFVIRGISEGRRQDLTGGGLLRSVGGWTAIKTLRKTGALQKGDERILGDGEFVDSVLAQANEDLERRHRLKVKGGSVDGIAVKVAEIVGISISDVWARGKKSELVLARSLLCFWATSELGISQVWLSKKLGISPSAVSFSVARGRKIIEQRQYVLDDL
jgi:REP element-mobilizing transposase RayT